MLIFLVDGYNSFCGEYNQNRNISTGSVAYVNDIKINGGNVNITGQVVQVQTCEVDASQIIDKARQSNNNSVIPPHFIKDGKLKLENNDKLTLPSGVYYFGEIKVSGRAVLEFSGPATSFGAGGWDLLVLKLDSQGNIQWAKTYGGPANENPYGSVIDQLPDGGYILMAPTSSFGAGGWDKCSKSCNRCSAFFWGRFKRSSSGDKFFLFSLTSMHLVKNEKINKTLVPIKFYHSLADIY